MSGTVLGFKPNLSTIQELESGSGKSKIEAPSSTIDSKASAVSRDLFAEMGAESEKKGFDASGMTREVDVISKTPETPKSEGKTDWLDTLGKVALVAALVITAPLGLLILGMMALDKWASANDAQHQRECVQKDAVKMLENSIVGQENPDGTHKVETYGRGSGWQENWERGLTFEELLYRAKTGNYFLPDSEKAAMIKRVNQGGPFVR